jgi:iron(III) transport system substrate-binding protein
VRRRLMVSKTGKLILATVVAMLSVACGSSGDTPIPGGGTPASALPGTDDKLIQQAQEEGQLVLYGSPRDEAMKADADAFRAAYGINVSFMRIAGAPLTSRVDAEVKAGRVAVDVVFSPDVAALDRWAQDGALEPIPEVDYPTREKYHAVMQIVGQGIVYNTDLISGGDVPKTWKDLLKPQFKDMIVIGDPSTSGAYSQNYFALLEDERYGEDYFNDLKAQSPRVETLAIVNQSVAAGDAAAGFTSFPTDPNIIKSTAPSAPIEFTYLDVVSAANTYLATMANSPHPAAAKLFAAFMMSREGQTAHNGDDRATSPLGELDGTLPGPDPDALSDVTVVEATKELSTVVDLFRRLY